MGGSLPKLLYYQSSYSHPLSSLPGSPFPWGCWHSPGHHLQPCSSHCSRSSWRVSFTPTASVTMLTGLTQSSASPAHTSLLSLRPMYPAVCWTAWLKSPTGIFHSTHPYQSLSFCPDLILPVIQARNLESSLTLPFTPSPPQLISPSNSGVP